MFLVLLAMCLGVVFLWMFFTICRNRATVLMLQKRLPNFKVVPAIPVFGSMYHFKDPSAEGIFKTFCDFDTQYGKTLITQSLFNFPSIHVCDAKVIGQIMQARTIEKTIIYDFMTPWLGTGLIVSTGSKWTQRRKIITPAFHFKILEDFLVIMNHQSDVLIEKLKTSANGTDCNIYNHVTYCALDIISESAMSVKLNTQHHPNSEYVLAVKEMTDIILKRLFSLLREYKWAFQFTKAHRRQRELVKVIHDFAHK
uniref:Cytochrome P450 n=1 Tax=Anopheles quadriannulatus TaxID=34691 RepID=A0A182XUM8_ANOQN